MSLHKFQHINIPYDQLQLFNSPQINQMFLIQTLLFSTKITLYVHKHKYSTSLVITKHNIWFKDENKKRNIFALPLGSLLALVKCQEQPQLVFVTDARHDNFRISSSNQHRCNSIISALSYIFTRIIKNHSPLKVIFSKQNNLKSFQKSLQVKSKHPDFFDQLSVKYTSNQIAYQQPSREQIYGHLNLQNKKICLMKQIYNNKTHMIHIAKAVSFPLNLQDTHKNQQQKSIQNYYYIHTIQKAEGIIELLKDYQSLPYENLFEQLVYVRELDYKLQLFFRYLPQVPKEGSPCYNYQLTPERLFINLIQFYDVILVESPETVLDFSLLCYEKVSASLRDETSQGKIRENKRSFRLQEEYNTSFSEIIIKIRQFRYQFLLTGNNQFKKLAYQCYYDKGKVVYEPHSWKTKFYHLALILYEFMYGKQYFSTEYDPQTILKMKINKNIIFPRYLNTQSNSLMSWQLQDFMEKAIKVKFRTLQDLYDHPWIRQSVLILAHQHPARIYNKDFDKKTDATISF